MFDPCAVVAEGKSNLDVIFCVFSSIHFVDDKDIKICVIGFCFEGLVLYLFYTMKHGMEDSIYE